MTYRPPHETLYEETELRQIKERLDAMTPSDADLEAATSFPPPEWYREKWTKPETAREKFRRAKRAVHKRREGRRK